MVFLLNQNLGETFIYQNHHKYVQVDWMAYSSLTSRMTRVKGELIKKLKYDHIQNITEKQCWLRMGGGIHNQYDIRIVKVFTVLLPMTKVGAAFLLLTPTTDKEKYRAHTNGSCMQVVSLIVIKSKRKHSKLNFNSFSCITT